MECGGHPSAEDGVSESCRWRGVAGTGAREAAILEGEVQLEERRDAAAEARRQPEVRLRLAELLPELRRRPARLSCLASGQRQLLASPVILCT